jgi:hypothetical protein
MRVPGFLGRVGLFAVFFASALPALAAAQTPPRLTVDAVRNAEYSPEGDPIRLKDGVFKQPPPGEDPSLWFFAVATDVERHRELIAFGDLDGDGVEDAVVALTGKAGGSGTFFYAAAVLNRGGAPVNVATEDLGDRVWIHALAIRAQEIVIDVTTHARGDAFCCPTLRAILRYRLDAGRLVGAPINPRPFGEPPAPR